jgi:hypothetical protein
MSSVLMLRSFMLRESHKPFLLSVVMLLNVVILGLGAECSGTTGYAN